MTPELWLRIEPILEQALARDVAERARFLERACGDDPRLQADVASFLAVHERAEGFLESDVTAEVAAPEEAPAAAPEPAGAEERHIGPYRILRRIARGGMGTVYEAARDDRAFRRRVAIKVIRPGPDAGEVARRFHGERHILAELDHPNVARLLDGGTTEDGEAYFVMEHVEGIRIDAYCDRERLSVQDRLVLFRKVCAAVGYAHQNLVVHRDLKPSNILVTDEGEPKLLDFGIAKLLRPEAMPFAVAETRTGLAPMTPRYASPEQIRGQAVGTASDVYSLGVLLYELLVGTSPYPLESAGLLEEIQHAVSEEEPPPPSVAIERLPEAEAEATASARGVRAADLRRQLQGDLDHIVARALRKEPRHRYGSVEQLSEDVGRHQESLPVHARRGSFTYRSGKFVRRNRLAVAVLGAVASVTVLFIAALIRQSHDLARERQRAERSLSLLVDLFRGSEFGTAPGSTLTMKQLLDSGAGRVIDELDTEPEIQATLTDAVGQVYLNLGLYDQAEPFLEDALELRRRIYGDRHLEVATSLQHLAQARHELGRYPEAERLFREALALRRERLGSDHLEVAETLDGLSTTLRWSGKLEGSEGIHREALEIRRRQLGPHHPLVAQSLDSLASLHLRRSELRRAEELFRQAVEIQRHALGEEHPQTAMTLKNLGLTLQLQGRSREAVEILSQTLGILRKTLGNDHPWISLNLMNLARATHEAGDLEAAEAQAREALERQEKTLDPDHPDRVRGLSRLSLILLDQGRQEAARAALLEADRIAREKLEPEHTYHGYVQSSMGTLSLLEGRLHEAETRFRDAIRLFHQVFGEDSLAEAETLLGLGRLATARDDPSSAETFFRRALEIRERWLPAGHWRIAVAEGELGACLVRQGRGREGRRLLERSLALLEDQLPAADARVAAVRETLAQR